jgi:hypothetical protein
METTFLLSDTLRPSIRDANLHFHVAAGQTTSLAPKTLAEHARRGNIEWRKKGFGRKRPRRVVTQSDVIAFLRRISVTSEDACRTSAEYAAPVPRTHRPRSQVALLVCRVRSHLDAAGRLPWRLCHVSLSEKMTWRHGEFVCSPKEGPDLGVRSFSGPLVFFRHEKRMIDRGQQHTGSPRYDLAGQR